MFEPKYKKQFEKEYYKLCRKNPQKANDIGELVKAVLTEPRAGIGHPERLRHKVNEMWSRHIDKKNRLIYTIEGDTVYFESCEGHYNNH